MNYELFRNTFEKYLIVSTCEINAVFPDFDTKRLTEWQRKGYISKLVNKWYCFPSFAQQANSHFLAANCIYAHSYISLQSALSYYGLIPELVTSVTSLTTKINAKFKTGMGDFFYNHIKPRLMFGYHLLPFENPFIRRKDKIRQIRIADIEKAILDYFYINARIADEKDIAEVRIDPDVFYSDVNIDKLNHYLSKYCNNALERRIVKLLKIQNS